MSVREGYCTIFNPKEEKILFLQYLILIFGRQSSAFDRMTIWCKNPHYCARAPIYSHHVLKTHHRKLIFLYMFKVNPNKNQKSLVKKVNEVLSHLYWSHFIFYYVFTEFLWSCCILWFFVSFNVVSLMFVGLVDQSGKSLPKVCGLLNNLWRCFV